MVRRRSLVAAETDVQRAILDAFALMKLLTAHVPNGAFLAGNKEARARQMARLKADGLRPGFPDLIVFAPGSREHVLHHKVGTLEVKRSDGGNGLSVDQEWWRDALQDRGIPWALVSSVTEAVDAVKLWGFI